ncbi:transglycosylase SLT domain-containing protein [Paracoccus suum]|uniref:transglycosylase SLT domain-containing protein n=1 Tax=Paracoccus suum TaxID=2259340 RepID=UPI001F546B92|nr:transglycosylase SLT domain-containing protein [Paracoccus suum]
MAAESGVPADILGALTLTETGRRADGVVRPWAWSVNAEGKGTWFDAPGPALAYAEDRLAQGRRNLDIGCFQLNYRWHGAGFASVSEMFDPVQNARYAARFLRQLYDESGDWRAAAGAFHSRRPADARKYLARFDELRAGLQQRGWAGLMGTPETYNSFAAEAGDAAVTPGGLVGVLHRIAGAGPGSGSSAARHGAVEVTASAGPETVLDGGQAPADEVGGAMPADALGLGVEVPVPDGAQGGGLNVALDSGGSNSGGTAPGVYDGLPSIGLSAGLAQAPLDGTAPGQQGLAAKASGQWPPQPLPGEEISLQQLAMDLTGQSGGKPAAGASRRHRESQAGTMLLGAIRGSGEAGGAGSLAVLAEARGPLLQGSASLLARGQP